MTLVIDNYDSFTFNLVQLLGSLGGQPRVVRNDKVTVAQVEDMRPSHIVISPGPCTPKEAGVSMEVLRAFAGRVPLLGVCLGHQCLGQAFGGKVVRAPVPVHGKTAWVEHDGRGVYRGLSQPFEAARYHSLVVERSSLPECLEVTAWSGELVMGVRHRELPWVEGIQFHPESFLTREGRRLVANFLEARLG